MAQAFVSRERELGQLDALLERALQGSGSACFVTGEAGFGKTSLALEFSRRAQRRHAELLVAFGDCNAQTGICDPYLPFRELFGMLAGDTRESVAQGTITPENAGRLQEFLRISKQVIGEVAPDLIELFVPGAGLVTKASVIVAGERRAHRAAPGLGSAAASVADASPAALQDRVFEQFTAMLVALAQRRPLLLVLDDLQWIDESSASLLFHLGRRIEGSRILLVGTYRPEDVAIGRGGGAHPLVPVVAELKSKYGEVFVVLGDESADEVRGFVDALLETEPNRLGDAFREELGRRTRGHPLFATELLRTMQERGDLVRDAEGLWVEGSTLDWRKLPARVEGVIEERIGRVRRELHELLALASVEGEVFTVQVLGRLQQIEERALLKTLSQELDRQHRLVREERAERLGAARIWQFRFRHQMFQHYFYHQLGELERSLLHEDVAAVLEVLYEGRTETIAGQLARHYEIAGADERAAACFLQAGRTAQAMNAPAEAIALARRGLACVDRAGGSAVHGELRLELLLLLGETQQAGGKFDESMRSCREAAELAEALDAPEALARAALGYDEPRWRLSMLDPVATTLLRRALARLDATDSALRVRLLAHLARGLHGQADEAEVGAVLDEALDMARRLDDPRALLEAMEARLGLDRSPAHVRERLALIDKMVAAARRLGDGRLEVEILAFRIVDLAAIGDVDGWQRELEAQRLLAEQLGEPFWTYNAPVMRTALALNEGRFADAERFALEAMDTGQKLGIDNVEGVLGVQMFTIRREQGRLREIAPLLTHFLAERGAGAAWRPGLALIHADLGHTGQARAEFDTLAANDFGGLPRDSLWQASLCYLAEVCDFLQDRARARVLHELLAPFAGLAAVVSNATVCLGATSRYLGQLATVCGDWALADAHFGHALEFNTAMRAAPWLAHTQVQYARMLRLRNGAGDAARAAELLAAAAATAGTLGMRGLLERMPG